MRTRERTRRVLIIDDEPRWQNQLSRTATRVLDCRTVIIASYEAAQRYVASRTHLPFDLALVDLRMRPEPYDQGGLALVSAIRENGDLVPVVLLTAYADDYPGLRATVTRMGQVLVYSKDEFIARPEAILSAILSQVRPGSPPIAPSCPQGSGAPMGRRMTDSLAHLGLGTLAVLLVLAAGYAVFFLLDRFSSMPTYSSVLFGLVALALTSTLVAIYGRETLGDALKILCALWRRRRSGR